MILATTGKAGLKLLTSPTINSEELKPCPFCGWGTIVEVVTFASLWGFHSYGCNACGTRTKPYKSEKEAIAAWNRRVNNESKDA